MNFDFSLLLVVLVGICGAITLLDTLWLAPRRRAHAEASSEAGTLSKQLGPDDQRGAAAMPIWIEYPRSFFPVLFIVLLLRSFLFEPFQIPSGSMLPTLRIGDFILVNKYAYGLRLPVLGTKIVDIGEPARGDILVFKYPVDERINYIKRIIGLPGDKIVYSDKRITINGQPLEYNLTAATRRVEFLTETLGDIEHQLQVTLGMIERTEGSWTVPEGHYFVMGDNRDNSSDSRRWGFVPEANIVGKAFAIWMHKPGLIPSFSRNGAIQ